MSGQIIELIIFGAIAFFVINKLIATLGTTSEDDPAKTSHFGEPAGFKDVTDSRPEAKRSKADIIKANFKKRTSSKINLDGFVVPGHIEDVKIGLKSVTERMDFDIEKFLKGSKSAFAMLVEFSDNKSDSIESDIESLVDKRFIEEFSQNLNKYGNFCGDQEKLGAQISELYMFGNNVFVKVLFYGKQITSKMKELNEEWTFTKNVNVDSPNWHLTNIGRPQ
jgi:predicted lipid-binding transport protein (Tim44 family)